MQFQTPLKIFRRNKTHSLDVVFINADSSAAAYQGYGFLSYETYPLATKHVPASEVVKFRDDAWKTYHLNPKFLCLIEEKYGLESRNNIEELAKVKLKHRILGD